MGLGGFLIPSPVFFFFFFFKLVWSFKAASHVNRGWPHTLGTLPALACWGSKREPPFLAPVLFVPWMVQAGAEDSSGDHSEKNEILRAVTLGLRGQTCGLTCWLDVCCFPETLGGHDPGVFLLCFPKDSGVPRPCQAEAEAMERRTPDGMGLCD